jgi:hypothetical protein
MDIGKRLALASAAAFAAAMGWVIASAVLPVDASGAYRGTWRVSYRSATTIDLELSYRNGHSSWSSGDTVPFDSGAFSGLTLDDIKSASGERHFRIVRDAGSFDCNGYFASGNGAGVLEFVPSSTYAGALESRGLGRPSDSDQFSLALADVRIETIDRLRAAGIAGLSAKALVRMADHDVTAKYVEGLTAGGVKPASVDDLIRLRDHDVQPDYISGLARYGYRPGVDELVRLRDHDVTIDFVARLKSHGYSPSVDELIRLRDTGM